MTLEELVKQLSAVFGNELRSVVLYGSGAAGEHIANRSDYNVLVIADTLDAKRLRALSATTRAWVGAGNPPPMMFTPAEWRDSIDVFPMEHADMLDRHKLLFGASPFDDMRVDAADLRLQLEHEARGKLLALRQGLLASAGDRKAELRLLSGSLSAVMVLFRAVERLRGARPSRDNVELSRSVAAAAGFAPEPFERVVRHVRGEVKLAPADAPAMLDGYLRGVEGVVQFLDQFDAQG